MCVLNTTFALLFLMAIKVHQSKTVREYQKRAQKACADIQVIECMKAHANQYSNNDNKAQFILLLSRYLKFDGQAVHVYTLLTL